MRIVCDGCAAKYSNADDKIRGKVFKIRCKKCSNVIVVRASADVPEQVSADPDAIWYLVLDGEQIGPLTVGPPVQATRRNSTSARECSERSVAALPFVEEKARLIRERPVDRSGTAT